MPAISRILLPIWLIALCVGCRSTYSGPSEELLAKGKAAKEAKKYPDATRYFLGIDRDHVETAEHEEGLFHLADTRRLRGKGQSSFQTYRRFVEKYPNSRFSVAVAEGEFQLAMDHLEGRISGFLFFGSDQRLGVTIMEHLQLHFPNHSLADDALVRAADFELKAENYDNTIELLQRLLSDYPRRQHRFWARYQLARTLWLTNEGAVYDDLVLQKSKRAFEDFVATVKAAGVENEHAEHVAAAQAMMLRIDERRAEREYANGRFYERIGRPMSARVHYETCVSAFPTSQAAEKSKNRMQRLGSDG